MGFVLCRSMALNLDSLAIYYVHGYSCSLISFIRWTLPQGWLSEVHTVFQPSLPFSPPLVSYSLNDDGNVHGLRIVPVRQGMIVSNLCDLFQGLVCMYHLDCSEISFTFDNAILNLFWTYICKTGCARAASAWVAVSLLFCLDLYELFSSVNKSDSIL